MSTATHRKRLEALEAPPKATERRGLLVMPPIETDTDAWSERACAQQTELARLTREGVDEPVSREAKGSALDSPYWLKRASG